MLGHLVLGREKLDAPRGELRLDGLFARMWRALRGRH
jgi:hypothetical protein